MTSKDILEETYSALSANKVRSGLTVLGIVIGISSVIAMIAIGQGAQSSIDANIQSLGSNLIEILPGATKNFGAGVSLGRGSSHTLTVEDATAISQLSNVTAVAAENLGRYQITAKGTNTNTTVDGVTSSYPSVRNVQIQAGNFISDQDNASLNKVAVLGPTAMTDLFGADADPNQVIGQTIRIKNLIFTVIGITASKGSSAGANQDDMIYIPLQSAIRYLAGSNYVTTINVEADNQNDMTNVQNDATSLLLQRHNISDPTQADFSTLNQSDIVAAAGSVASTFTILLAAVAGISLVVGGIGIMNMMLTTVTERTREIGLRKAIGAKAADINRQFLIEAVMLTLIGGACGVALGWMVAWGLTHFGIIKTSVSLLSVVLAVGVSAAIGIAFGYYPARRASRLNPIEALRYE